MKQENRGVAVACAVALFGFIVGGCAARPMTEESEQARPLERASPGSRVEFPAEKFSVESPPAPWEIRKEEKAVVAWNSRETFAVIQVHAAKPCGCSYRLRAEIFPTILQSKLREKDRDASVTLAQENEVLLNGKQFHQVLMDFDVSPIGGIQVRGRFLVYLLTTKAFDYVVSLTAALGVYEKERLILEQVVRSFAPID